MRQRVPHILSTIKDTTLPSNVLLFDTETRDAYKKKRKKKERHRLWFGYALAYRRQGVDRSCVTDLYFTDINSFWRMVESRIQTKKPLYVYCHNAPFDLTIVDFWRYSQVMKWKIEFAVLENPPVIISAKTPYGRLHIIDTMNYFKVSLKELGKSVGLPKLDIDFQTCEINEAKVYCKRDVDILALSMDQLCRFVEENKLGKLGSTVASLAFSTYRHRFMGHDIYIHNRERILKMERDSYHGGMVNSCFIGTVGKHMTYKLDVNSLYPAVMKNRYPVKLKYSIGKPSINHVISEMKKYGCIADCSVHTTDIPLPYKPDKELLFALGSFRTTLVGPELQRAISAGSVTYIHWAAFYQMESIFDDYIDFFWSKRAEYKAKGDEAGRTFCKYMMNSLYGKFAQGIYQWIPLTLGNVKDVVESIGEHLPEVYDDRVPLPKMDPGQRSWILAGVSQPLKVRKVSSCMQVQRKIGYHAESFIAIASYVTSYAREYLRSIISIAGERNTFYYDTDSVFVNKAGRNRLRNAGLLSETSLGGLKEEGREYGATFLCPKDYVFGNNLCLKGIRKNAEPICKHSKNWSTCSICPQPTKTEMLVNGKFEQQQFEGLPSIIKRGYDPYIDITTVRKTVTHHYKKGVVLSDGWTRPFIIQQGELT